MSTTKDIVIVAAKSTVRALDQVNGTELWSQKLASGLGTDFVSVVADAKRVYAHAHGRLYCLDLRTGSVLWSDGLAGLGYGIASIALPGVGATGLPQSAARIQQDAADSAAIHAG